MCSYAQIDPIIEKWVTAIGSVLFTEWADAPARYFHAPGDPPFECFQISVDAPTNNAVSVPARAVDTNDDTEDQLTRTWTGSTAELDDMMRAAVETIEAWKTRPRQMPDPPSPWE